MCRVAKYNEIQEEIKRLTNLQNEMKAQFIQEMEATGVNRIMAEDGIHFISYVSGYAPRWVEEKTTPAHMDNGRKASVKYN